MVSFSTPAHPSSSTSMASRALRSIQLGMDFWQFLAMAVQRHSTNVEWFTLKSRFRTESGVANGPCGDAEN